LEQNFATAFGVLKSQITISIAAPYGSHYGRRLSGTSYSSGTAILPLPLPLTLTLTLILILILTPALTLALALTLTLTLNLVLFRHGRLQVPRLVRREERGLPLVLLRGELPGSVHPERQLRRDDVPGYGVRFLCARHRLPHLFLPIRPAPQPCLRPSLSHRPAAHTRRPPSWQATCTSRSRQSARRPWRP